MKITLDEGKGCGSGQCVLTALDLFDQREEDGIAVLLHPYADPEQHQRDFIGRIALLRGASIRPNSSRRADGTGTAAAAQWRTADKLDLDLRSGATATSPDPRRRESAWAEGGRHCDGKGDRNRAGWSSMTGSSVPRPP
ncbi:hypothetical protein [Nonomuraea composti]|uniref:ferredoxin n=1 Tax=Nonomuraea composti TaxID=2720023 RepID=UPI0032047870